MTDVADCRLIAIEKTSSPDYLARVFECYRNGDIAVPVDRDAPAPEGWAFAERVTPAAGGGWFTQAVEPRRDDAPAQISFSSGTTGTPKAILISHRALADVTDRLIGAMEIDSEISEYLGVPATYSFGLARARVVAAAGGKLYIPPHGFDPGELVRMLDAGEVNALSAVPTLLRVLLANPDIIGRKTARKLRWLEIGSQPMSAEDKRAIRRMFPAARIIQHYGLTEASRTTFLDLQEASDDALESVGRAVGATEIRIDGDGHVCIRGPHLADGILQPDGVVPLVDGDGWLRTNDLGRIDAQGNLHFLGRADHLLNIGGIKVPAEVFEQRLAPLIGAHAAAVAVAGMPDPLRGEVVMVAHCDTVTRSDLLEPVRQVGTSFGLSAADVRLVEVASIPRTDTGKIRRAELAALAATGPAVASVTSTPPATVAVPAETQAQAAGTPAADDGYHNDREREIAEIWRDALGVEKVGRNETFFDMGGDSLSAINVMLRMERAGVSKEITQQIFEGRTVAEMAATNDGAPRQPPARRVETSDAIVLTRGILVLVVIAGHWLPFVLVRMGSLSEAMLKWTSPLFRFGTPGFAIVFGIGLAFFNMGLIKKNPERFRSNTRTNLLLLGSGVGLLAVFRGIHLLLTDSSSITVVTLFYGVLLSYLLLVATSGLLLRFIGNRREALLTALIVATTSLIVSALTREMWRGTQSEGLVELGRLLMVNKYGYPEMLGYTALGVVAGLWIDRTHDAEHLPRQGILGGIALLLISALLTITLGLEDLWFDSTASMQMIVAYCGCVLILFGLSLHLIRGGAAHGVLKLPIRTLSMVGILAFLAYVGHEIAMSLHDILGALNVNYTVSICVSVGLFFVTFALAARWLYRLYYRREA